MTRGYNKIPYVPAVYFTRLCNMLPHEKVSDLLGVGYSTISRYKSNGECPKHVEKAAEFELMKRDKANGSANLPVKAPDEIVILKVPHDKMEYLMMFLKGAGIKNARFKDSA